MLLLPRGEIGSIEDRGTSMEIILMSVLVIGMLAFLFCIYHRRKALEARCRSRDRPTCIHALRVPSTCTPDGKEHYILLKLPGE